MSSCVIFGLAAIRMRWMAFPVMLRRIFLFFTRAGMRAHFRFIPGWNYSVREYSFLPSMQSNLPEMPNRSAGRRILCADDHTLLGDVLVRIFSLAGHSIERVHDGQEAWDAMSRDLGAYDVLITDHQMPRLDGIALVRLLREADYRGRVIVHGSSLNADAAALYRTLAVDSIVAKTTKPEELLNIVEAFYGESD